MADKHSYCNREKEIAELYTDMKLLKPIIMGNGKEGLAVTVPKLDKSVNDLEMAVKTLDRNVDRLVNQQAQYKGEKDGKEEIRKRNRWVIGILLTLASMLLGTVGYLMSLILNYIDKVT